jgi:hypothetical protein
MRMVSLEIGRFRGILKGGTKNSVDLSIAAPAYDEGSALPLFIRRTTAVLDAFDGDAELIEIQPSATSHVGWCRVCGLGASRVNRTRTASAPGLPEAAI